MPDTTSLFVAVVQIETHPAITVEAADFMGEPFYDDEKLLLSTLLRYDDGNGIPELQKIFREEYLKMGKLPS